MTRNLVRTASIAALLLAHALCAAAALKLDAPVPVGPRVKVGKLANGLTYYIQQNKKPEQKLELRLVVKAGSILEDDDQQGLAHFTEHMAFNGSTHFKRNELVSWLQSIGVKFGADLNAYTTFDETVYILPIPTDRKDNVDKAFTVLEDWAHGVTFNDEDIDKERGIILEEARLGKGATDRMSKVLLPKIFNGSRYAERLPIGQEEIIRSFKPDTLRRFYRDWYRPDLMAVVAIGDIDPKQAEKLVKQHFAGLKNPAHERPREYADIPTRLDTEAVVVTDKEATSNSLLIRYPVQPVHERETIRGYREMLVEGLFTVMLNTRLQELSQLPSPPFIGGGSALSKLTPRYQSYNASALLGPGGATPAIDALVQENERARKYGFTEAELDRARKDMLRTYERAYIERDKTDSGAYASEYMRNFLHQEPIPGIETEYHYVQQLVPGITLAEMNAYARRTIPENSGKLVVYSGVERPDVPPPPTGGQLLAAVAAAEHAQVARRDEKAVAARLMDKPPAPGSIVAESEDKALGLTLLTLSNGVKVILKPTDFRNDQVVMSAARFGGQTLFGDQDIINARYANAIVASMGVKDFSPLDMHKVLAGKAAAVNMGLGTYADVVSGQAGATDVETMLQLVWLKFAGVRRDEDLFKSFIGKQVELARTRMAEPAERFGDTVLATLYNNNPRAPRALRPEEFSKISLDRSIEIYRQRFSSAKDLTFIFVGSFDPKAIKPLLATYLGSLPTPDIPVGYRDVGMRPVTGVVKRELKTGADDKSTVSLTFTGPAEFSEPEQMRLGALIELMNLRIIDVLREKLSLIYGGSLTGGMSRIPYGHYSLSATLPTGPQNVDKVLAALFTEIERMKTDGPDPADLEKVKRNWLESHRKALRENGYWLAHLMTAQTEGTDPHTILDFEKQVASITAQDVKAAAQRYFNTSNYVQVVLYPEKQDKVAAEAAHNKTNIAAKVPPN